jgi:peroxiredoxin
VTDSIPCCHNRAWILVPCVLMWSLVTTMPDSRAQGKYNKLLAIGDAAPSWAELPGTDGRQHSLAKLKDAAVVVVCFTSNTCLYSIDYEDRLIELDRKYSDNKQGVRIVAINSNAFDKDDLDHMKQRAAEKRFPFAYLRDDDQAQARAWGAIYTPEFFVLDGDRNIVYMGALDDSTNPDEVSVRYVELAINAVLSGTDIKTAETPARGCTIRMPRRRRPSPDPISSRKR